MPGTSRFRISLARSFGIVGFIVLFAAWTCISIYAITTSPPRPSPNPGPDPGVWLAYLFMCGTPFGMMLLSIVYMLSVPRLVEVDDHSIRTQSLLGKSELQWSEVSGTSLDGVDTKGITLYAADGRKLSVDTSALDSPIGARNAIMPRIPELNPAAPIRTTMAGRKVVLWLMAGILGFVLLTILTMGTIRPDMWLVFGMLLLMLVPLMAYSATYVVTLADGKLSTKSCFGKKEIVLDPGVYTQVDQLNGKGGPSERLVVIAPSGTKIYLSSRLMQYPAMKKIIESAVLKKDHIQIGNP